MNRARIVLADDHPTILEGIIATLESDYEIVGVFRDGETAVEGVKVLRPELVIMDISMPLLGGLEAAARIHAVLPETKLLFFTMHARPGYEAAALKVGACGMVLKSSPPDVLRLAIHRILNNSEYWPSKEQKAFREIPKGRVADSGPPQLTPRELEVLQMIAEGQSAKEIAYKLNISTWTVTFHRQHIKKKLGINSTADLTRFAIEYGLL